MASGVADCIGVYGAVFKLNAVGYALHIVFGDVAVAPYVIYFLLHEFGVCELGGKVAVVGEQEYACGVAVEASYGVDAFRACAFHEVHDGEASVGVIACGHAVFGLVEQNVALALEGNNLVVVLNHIVVGDFCAEFGYYLTVDLYEALLDKFVGFAARADACVAHVFVEANLFVGIRSFNLVFNAFGAWGEAFSTAGE